MTQQEMATKFQAINAWAEGLTQEFEIGDYVWGCGLVKTIEDGKANGEIAFCDAKVVVRRNRELGVWAIWQKDECHDKWVEGLGAGPRTRSIYYLESKDVQG
ncbi:MAG TPA: hypothetical protein PKX44_08000 [Methanomassiliicoccaceae archaeon]|nr:hypothetical protein [Methanomassiliicoccaceae archaeon]